MSITLWTVFSVSPCLLVLSVSLYIAYFNKLIFTASIEVIYTKYVYVKFYVYAVLATTEIFTSHLEYHIAH